jgi:hypothetical protein
VSLTAKDERNNAMTSQSDPDEAFEVAQSMSDPTTIYIIRKGQPVEVYHNHNFDGGGCNNYVIEVNGQQLDLEFVRSI